MTMHLEVGLTTLNTKKRKTKRKPDAFYELGWRKHNKFLKRLHTATMTLKEYIDYVLLGVDSVDQLKSNINTIKNCKTENFNQEVDNIVVKNNLLLNPANWNI